jgi:hypothetical protein
MATWHQRRTGNDRPLLSKDWSVFSNPPNQGCGTTTGFKSCEEAQEHVKQLIQHHPDLRGCVWVIAPTKRNET